MISFAVTTHNEGQYIQDLLDQLVPYCEKTIWRRALPGHG